MVKPLEMNMDAREKAIEAARKHLPINVLETHVSEAIDAYEAALWQPIETAPKDGSTILTVWIGEVRTARFLDNSHHAYPWQGFKPVDMGPYLGQPTQWRPLPTPPAIAKETDQ